MPDDTTSPEPATTPTPPATPAEELTPMLDIHPAHHAASTWKDFFIHIATIVLGLLIAVSLEQTVEYIHHQHQLAETREALYRELEVNKNRIAGATAEFRRFTPILQTDLAILRFLEKRPGAPMSQWPGEYRLTTYLNHFNVNSWDTARQNNTVSLMPDEEATRYADIFGRLVTLNGAVEARTAARENVFAITMEDPDPSHLSPLQVTQAIDAIRKLLVAESNIARELAALAYTHPELGLTTPTPDERFRILPTLETPHSDSDRAAVNAAISKLFGNGKGDPYYKPSQEERK